MSLHNSHFKDTPLRICVIDVMFIVFQHIFVNHSVPFSLKIHSATYIISFLLKRRHILGCAHHCLLILNTKQWPCSHCARTFSCDLGQFSQCRVQVQRVLLTLTVCNFLAHHPIILLHDHDVNTGLKINLLCLLITGNAI